MTLSSIVPKAHEERNRSTMMASTMVLKEREWLP
jgi:hypothetical protein